MVTIAVRPAGGAALRRATRCALFGAVRAPLAYCVCTVMLGVCEWGVDVYWTFCPLGIACMFGFWLVFGGFVFDASCARPRLWQAWPSERVAAAVVSDVAVVSDDGVTTASAEAAAVDPRVERKSQGETSERAAVAERPQHWTMELSLGCCHPSRGRSPGTAACQRRPSCEATSMVPSEGYPPLTRRHTRVWSRSPCAAGPAKLRPTPAPAPMAQ